MQLFLHYRFQILYIFVDIWICFSHDYLYCIFCSWFVWVLPTVSHWSGTRWASVSINLHFFPFSLFLNGCCRLLSLNLKCFLFYFVSFGIIFLILLLVNGYSTSCSFLIFLFDSLVYSFYRFFAWLNIN